MLSCPRLLHELIVGVDVVRFVPEFLQVAGIEIRHPEQALIAGPQLLLVGLLLQTWMLAIEPVQKFGVIGVEEEDLHLSNVTRHRQTMVDPLDILARLQTPAAYVVQVIGRRQQFLASGPSDFIVKFYDGYGSGFTQKSPHASQHLRLRETRRQ